MYSIIKSRATDIVYLFRRFGLWKAKENDSFRVLLYHNIGGRYHNDRFGISVPLENFKNQMEFLHLNGYNVFPLEELIYKIKNRQTIPSKSLAITFDDGYSENLENILFVLKKYGFVATFFVTVGYIENNSRQPKREYWEYLNFFTWEKLKGILHCGNSVGSHFYSHKNLLTLSADEVREEIKESRRIIEQKLGNQVVLFSYPHGKFNERIGRELRESGCLAACTSIAGRNSFNADPYMIKRIPINAWDGLFELKKKITGCYDWAGNLQERIYSKG